MKQERYIKIENGDDVALVVDKVKQHKLSKRTQSVTTDLTKLHLKHSYNEKKKQH